ncbi:hypothetical protein SLEP1_g21576 [Rubroshorea leprosula]|uniref:Uncharacterized protein n=1 Tax=Rubroshorea leprosula TaxID=152421 RepID=A0AAV5JF56_9ROSI|nr:hypothetical protein SLEP1_g21576 [Rubroshorea leprosula]
MDGRGRSLVLLCLSCLLIPACSTTNTLERGEQLRYGELLNSSNGLFTLGFLRFNEASDKSFLGIWYNGYISNSEVDVRHEPVWIANRNNPIFNGSGILSVNHNGCLQILSGEREFIALYSTRDAIQARATLRSDGNFVLQQLNSDGSVKGDLWQSFDYPTDTLLPGMKLGFNMKTRLNWTLTSMRSHNSPASGSFTLGVDPNDTKQLVILRRDDVYWRSGPWQRSSSGFPHLESFQGLGYYFSFTQNRYETYFNVTADHALVVFLKLRKKDLHSYDVLAIYTDGTRQSLVSCTNQHNSFITVGCTKQNLPECRHTMLDYDYISSDDISMSSPGYRFSDSENLTLEDCKVKCLLNCSCLAFAATNDEDDTGCEIWVSRAFSEQTYNGRTIYMLPSKGNKWWLWLTIVVGGMMIIPTLFSVCYIIWKNFTLNGDENINQRTLIKELEGSDAPSISFGKPKRHKKDRNELHVFSFESIGLWLLNTLPNSWETFRVSWTNAAPNGAMTMEYAKTGVLNEEVRRINQAASSSTLQSDVLVIEDRGRSKTKGQGGRDKSRSKSRPKYKDLECHHCGKKGHIKKYCFQLKKEMRQGKKKDDDNENHVTAAIDEDLLFVGDENVINFASHETSWVMDSGAAYHVTHKKEFFTSYTSGDFGVLKMGDDGQTKVIGMGTVCLQTNNGTKLVLKDVEHAPDIRLNLIFAGKLDDDGYCSSFSDGQWKLTNGSLVVARGSKSSNLYLMQSSIAGGSVNVVGKDESLELWHKRLSHMSVRSYGGALYFVTFIDDHSRKLWVYPLKTKDQVLGVFNQFQALVERQTGKKWKCIRIENGGEYSKPFDNYCKEQGIRHQKTPPKTPQLNGLAERMNRTLMERVRCLLAEAKLPRTFWAEALNIVAHVINLSPTIALDNDVPDRVWYGKDVSYDNLRVFGCKAFVHVPKDERSKLDAKTRQCIFIGYGQDEFGYQLGDPVDKKLVRSCDVAFFEDQTIEDIDKAEKISLQSNESLVDFRPVVETMVPNAVENHLQNDEVQDDIHDEAMESEQKMEWLKAMKDEMKSLLDNHTFDLVKLPKNRKALKNRWVYRVKHEYGTLVPRYKARLVVKGFSQRKGVDFSEIFAPVVKMSSIRVVLGLAACLDLEVEQTDVKTAFLHGDLDEEIYMEQLEGFKVKGKENFLCKLKKSLYGLKQALKQCRDRAFRKLWLSQEKYIERVLQRFEMDKVKVVSTPLVIHFKLGKNQCPSNDDEKEDRQMVPYASVVSSLMYAMVCIRPDIAHAVGYTDSDMAGDIDTRKSTSGYLITFARGAVSWQLRLQRCVALSTIEAEFIATVEACKELLWMKRFTQELGLAQKRSEHIDVRYHWIRDVLDSKLLELQKIHIDENGSDMMTKALPRGKFEACCLIAGMAISST